MSAVAERTAVTINLYAACGYGTCAELADRFQKQLGIPNYSRGASVMAMPASLDEWRAEHRTARKRADRAARLGYRFAEIDRSQHNDDIHEINLSLPERQGRPMAEGYRKRHNHGPLPDYVCDRHRAYTYGVLQCDTLRAYLSLWRVGELALVSMILGHGAHLRNDVMYALIQGSIAAQVHHGGVAYYNRWDSGTEGLRYFKSKLGFAPADVEWHL